MNPLPAQKALDDYFLEARCRLLDLSAILDRVGRGVGADAVATDPRMERIRRALDAVRELPGGRAEAVQKIFSLDYDPDWPLPEPR